MLIQFLLFLLLVASVPLMTALLLRSRIPAPPGWTASEEGGIRFQLFVPDGASCEAEKKYPLVLSLHGTGGWGERNDRYLNEESVILSSERIQSTDPCFILAPQAPRGTRWVDVEKWRNYSLRDITESGALKAVLSRLSAVVTEFPIDTDRIYLIGASMGAFGVWDLILRHPQNFAAAVIITGGGDPTAASRAAGIPLSIFHYSVDPIVSVHSAREMVDSLREAGGNPTYTEFRRFGHLSSFASSGGVRLAQWLLAQRKIGGRNTP